MKTIYQGIIRLSQWRSRKVRVAACELLLLLPHCLKQTACGRNVLHDLNECARCGRCPLASLLDLKDRHGVRLHIARGGREAIAEARRPEIKAILSIACEKELAAGILAVWPKKVVAIPNTRPEGICKNTSVDVAQVEGAVQKLLGLAGL